MPLISLTTIEGQTHQRPDEVHDQTAGELALARELRGRIQGEVRFDRGSRALYATDASNYRQVPIGVVVPKTVDDVVETIAACHRHGAPVLSRGGGTSLAGQCCNIAVVMDMSKHLNRVLDIDRDRRLGRVQPGTVLDVLRHTAEQQGLTFGPDPSTHNHNTLGGMLGNDSCGSHSLLCAKHGQGLRTADNTHEMEVLTYDGTRMRVGVTSDDDFARIIQGGGRRGEIYAQLRAFRDKYAELIRTRFPKLPRRISGYNLPELLPENGCHVARALVGSESTLVTILEATLHLVPNPKARSLLILGYPDVYTAGDHLMDILPFQPTALEGMDHLLFEWVKAKGDESANIALMPPGKGFLIVEFGGDSKQDSDGQARRCMESLKKKGDAPHMKLLDDPHQERMIWKVREGGLGSTTWVPGHPDTWPGWEDSAVPPDKVGPYLRELRQLFDKYDYHPSLYGHFGQGCIHCRVGFDLYTAAGVQHFRSFMEEAADLVVRYGGSLSGEHGDGQARAELLPKMFGAELVQAFNEFKSIWDPDWKMNPGKVVQPNRLDQELRLGPDYHPAHVDTYFKFPTDKYTFDRAALRCVGVGECRRHEGGTMCPSYRVTGEEMHSTRGRAHLLFEMLQGDPLNGGWQDEHVREALDLCLACKGCKGDCPVNVDMATYKAEFLAHHYEGRLRPRHAYSMGLIYWWARLAALLPGLVNFVGRAPVLGDVAKWLGGIASQRQLPAFAPETFKTWFGRRGPRNEGKPRVILWPDTFTNHFHPEHGKAAVEVLEAAGYQVLVPAASLCCGRPLYDFGMLPAAQKLLRQILATLRPWIEAGVPVVGLEPSCTAVFRDELTNLFPDDQDALRLNKQTFLLSEFLNREAKDYQPPKLQRKALVHGHCHHKAIMKMDDEEALLKKMGLDFEVLDSGCCGMAGSFGFERGEHYDVSMAVGELVLLPAVRQAADDTLVIANGFSCETQIAQGAGRKALHLAEVLQMALRGQRGQPLVADEPDGQPSRAALAAGVAVGIGVGVLGGWLLARALTRK